MDRSLPAPAFNFLRAKYSNLRSKGNLRLDQNKLFSEYMEMVQLNPTVLDRLSIKDILSLRDSPEGKLFRKAWNNLFYDYPSDSDSLDEYLRIWKERLLKEIRRESRWLTLFEKGKKMLDIISLLIGVVESVTAHPIVGGISMGIELIAMDPIINFMLTKSGRLRFLVFANRLRTIRL